MPGYIGSKRVVTHQRITLPFVDAATNNVIIREDGTLEGVDFTPINSQISSIQNQINSIEEDITSLDTSIGVIEDAIDQPVSFPAGHILQIKHQLYDTLTVVTGSSAGSYSDTGITATITPSNTSNKILIMYNIEGIHAYISSYHKEPDFKLMRGSSDIHVHEQVLFKGGSSGYIPAGGEQAGFSCYFLDSPNTNTATTYKIQMRAGATGSGGLVGINSYGGTSSKGGGGSSILLMEVVG